MARWNRCEAVQVRKNLCCGNLFCVSLSLSFCRSLSIYISLSLSLKMTCTVALRLTLGINVIALLCGEKKVVASLLLLHKV